MPWREMTLNGINALLNRCYDLQRPVSRTFPVSVTLRASLAKLPTTTSRSRKK
jgi:LacI family transcriptional regulator